MSGVRARPNKLLGLTDHGASRLKFPRTDKPRQLSGADHAESELTTSAALLNLLEAEHQATITEDMVR
jgi:hypothetical protein